MSKSSKSSFGSPRDAHSEAGSPVRESTQSAREAMESLIVAILLALLFRGFEAQAFVIPTGSMAPTLQGRHKDICCPKCGDEYRAGAAQEVGSLAGPVIETTCPMCRYQARLDPQYDPNEGSFTGDRILVNKFLYQFTEPKRWDVIVFNFPGNAKQNYIKRLVGLPGERLDIRHGDVFAQRDGESEFTMLRKPANKLPYLMHPVYDTEHIAPDIIKVGWPIRWKSMSDQPGGWTASDDRTAYDLPASPQTRWLGYRHLPPRLSFQSRRQASEWTDIQRGILPAGVEQRKGELITDFYAYNAFRQQNDSFNPRSGWNWVGDLAGEALIKLEKPEDQGQLSLLLVEGGVRFVFEIDLDTGNATVSIQDGATRMTAFDGGIAELQADTSIKGRGTHRLMWANVDDRLALWVDHKLVQFKADGKPHNGFYALPNLATPKWSVDDPGDAMPVAVGAKGVTVQAKRLRVLRDIYYVTANGENHGPCDIAEGARRDEFLTLHRLYQSPEKWEQKASLLSNYRTITPFELEADQFFPLGDNSPASKDARLWGGVTQSLVDGSIYVNSYVDRDYLIGKAFLVYWPHAWNLGRMRLPILPNLDRMGLIR